MRRWRSGRSVQSSEVPMRWTLLKKGKQVIARAEPTDGDMMALIVMHINPSTGNRFREDARPRDGQRPLLRFGLGDRSADLHQRRGGTSRGPGSVPRCQGESGAVGAGGGSFVDRVPSRSLVRSPRRKAAGLHGIPGGVGGGHRRIGSPAGYGRPHVRGCVHRPVPVGRTLAGELNPGPGDPVDHPGHVVGDQKGSVERMPPPGVPLPP
jgi:hypothetical protein